MLLFNDLPCIPARFRNGKMLSFAIHFTVPFSPSSIGLVWFILIELIFQLFFIASILVNKTKNIGFGRIHYIDRDNN